MKGMAIFLAAMGISVAAFAESSDVTTLPEGESAYGYSMSDPYTDGTIIVQEYVLVPADTIVLLPMEDESEASSHVPG